MAINELLYRRDTTYVYSQNRARDPGRGRGCGHNGGDHTGRICEGYRGNGGFRWRVHQVLHQLLG